ncbi:uncharacterized protein LOC112689130 [Sipha flava]|uniref:Uncharacterized protein LOC112689130 n=1 Tax=Sipha flava TaxID=143950 RepID=A0A8B8G5D4_9HEMI|nr:uncharacterized protein LOC112689130 [Sipha flava]
MEKIAYFEFFITNIKNEQVNEITDDITHLLNELSKLDPKCLREKDYEKLIKYLPLSLNIYNDQVIAAACNVIASLSTDELARQYFGQKIIISTVNIFKSLINRSVKDKYIQECFLQTCRAIGNLCYYHEENTKHALKEGCLIITMKVIKTISEESLLSVLIGLLLNLTHLDGYSYKFPDDMIEELNALGIKYINNNNFKLYINLSSIMINIVRKSSNIRKITDYEKCSFIDNLLDKYYMHLNITSICVKFIKQVSKTYNVYSWILKKKHKALVLILDEYEKNQEEEAKCIVKKICDIIILLSNDDNSMDNDKQAEVIYLVEWLLLKVHSNNLYIKLSAVRSLGNFSRFKYESNNIGKIPAKVILKHISCFINTLEKSVSDRNSLMEVSILCMFKNILYVTNFEFMEENDQNKLIKSTIEVLNHTTFNPIIMKSLDVIGCIIQKGGINQRQLLLYKNSTFIKQVTTYCSSDDEDISLKAKKLLYCIDEYISEEFDVTQSVEDNLQIIN